MRAVCRRRSIVARQRCAGVMRMATRCRVSGEWRATALRSTEARRRQARDVLCARVARCRHADIAAMRDVTRDVACLMPRLITSLMIERHATFMLPLSCCRAPFIAFAAMHEYYFCPIGLPFYDVAPAMRRVKSVARYCCLLTQSAAAFTLRRYSDGDDASPPC